MTNTAYTGTERKNYPKKVVKKYIKRLVFFLTLQMVSEKINGEKATFYSTALALLLLVLHCYRLFTLFEAQPT